MLPGTGARPRPQWAVLVLFAVAADAAPAPEAQPPRPIRVFTYSRDSVQGFADPRLDAFRGDVNGYLQSLMEVAYGRDDADVEVLLLGNGVLTLELGAAGDTERHLFQMDEDALRMWALVRIRGFAKAFSVEGKGARDGARLARSIADWLRANETSLRERLLEPGG